MGYERRGGLSAGGGGEPDAHAASHTDGGDDEVTVAVAQITGLGTAATVDTGTTSGTIPLLSTGGVLPIARLATGTPDGTKFVRDDGTLVTPAGGLSGIRVEDEGVSTVAAATGINFAGAGVVVTDAGSNEALVTIAGGGSLTGLRFAAATTDALSTGVTGDANDRFVIDADGTMWSGDGPSAPEQALRTSSGVTTLGRRAGDADLSGTITAVGVSAGTSNTSGTNITAVGHSALGTNTTGQNNTAVGNAALSASATVHHNTAVGAAAALATTGSDNVAVGSQALRTNTTGTYNVALGSHALYGVTTGASNIGIGLDAARGVTTGTGHVGIGTQAVYSQVTGSGSIGIGDFALRNGTAAGNIGIGHQALYSPAGTSANATTSGLRQTAVGYQTGQNGTTQRNDATMLGYQALVGANDTVALGSGAQALHANGVALGKGIVTTAINQVEIGPNHLEVTEMTEPAAGATNSARLYAKDNGAGKTQLCVRFATGAVQVIATEP